MSDAADALNSRQQWVDSYTAQLDTIRKRVCLSCVQPPFIKLGTWGMSDMWRCQSCGASVRMGAIVVDPMSQRKKPAPPREHGKRTKAGEERERLRRR
jgi:ribosomal protein L37AE/L43A